MAGASASTTVAQDPGGSLFGGWTLGYDDESRLTSVTYPEGEGSQTDSYWYNALGQRMRHHFSGGYRRYLYAGERVLEVTNDAGDDVRTRYTLGGGSYYQPLVHLWFAGDVDRFPAYDGSGTARRLLNDEGGAAVTWYLDAFGRYLSGSGSGSTKYRYGGAWGYITDPSDLQQLGARFYWPEIGRFVQQDPIGDGMNWYAYTDNNPLIHIDPTGKKWWCYIVCAGAGPVYPACVDACNAANDIIDISKCPEKDRENQKKKFGKCWKLAQEGHPDKCHECCDNLKLGNLAQGRCDAGCDGGGTPAGGGK